MKTRGSIRTNNGRFEDFLLFFRTSKKSREKTKDTQFLTPFF